MIHEIPYQVNKAAMLEKIQRLSQERKDALGALGIFGMNRTAMACGQ